MAGLFGSALGAQLVEAGLATEEQLEKTKLDKKKKPSQHKKTGAGKNNKRASGKQRGGKARNVAKKPGTDKVEVSESIVTRQVSKKSKVNELIRKNIVVDPAADQTFNFAVNGKLRELTVTATQAEQISNGELGIAKTDVSRDPYVLINAKAAIELRELLPARLVAFFDEPEEDKTDSE